MSLSPRKPHEITFPVKAIAQLSRDGAGVMTIRNSFPFATQELISDSLVYDNAFADPKAHNATKDEIIKVVRIIKSAIDVFEIDHARAYLWFQKDILEGYNKTPKQIFSEGKAETIMTYIDRVDHTVYA